MSSHTFFFLVLVLKDCLLSPYLFQQKVQLYIPLQWLCAVLPWTYIHTSVPPPGVQNWHTSERCINRLLHYGNNAHNSTQIKDTSKITLVRMKLAILWESNTNSTAEQHPQSDWVDIISLHHKRTPKSTLL